MFVYFVNATDHGGKIFCICICIWYLLSELCKSLSWLTMCTVDSFTVSLHSPNGRQLQCKGTVNGV